MHINLAISISPLAVTKIVCVGMTYRPGPYCHAVHPVLGTLGVSKIKLYSISIEGWTSLLEGG